MLDISHQVGKKLQEANLILITTHIRPDGDALGSLIGLGMALLNAGKNVQMVIDDPVPYNFHHLNGSSLISNKINREFDLSIAVDCSDVSRIGDIEKSGIHWDINIDHHITNERYAEINLIDPEAVATSEIIATHLQEWGLQFNKDVAEALMTGILTDTIGFRTYNMKPSVLRIAADLMEYGADLPNLYANGLYLRSFEAMRFWGAGLSRLARKGPIVWTLLTMEDRKAAGYTGKDDADLINVLSSINNSKVSVIFVEQPKGRIKISWRAISGLDVSNIAMQYGGGGHPAASGAEVSGEMDAIVKEVLEKTYQQLFGTENSL